MTYDSVEILKKFKKDKELSYPLLSDENAKHVLAYEILNHDYKVGDPGYGVPHPGVLYIDEDNVVTYKIASPGFRDRPSFEAIYSSISKTD